MNEVIDQAVDVPVESTAKSSSPETRFDDSLALLDTQGYCVIKEFLDAPVVAALAADYESRGRSGNSNYDIGLASGGAIDSMRERVAEITDRLGVLSSINVGFDGLHQAYYFAAQSLAFNFWHQDAESHYLFGTHQNYLNFYIPVIKPVREKTNLQVIPADVLRASAPGLWPKIENAGGTLCYVSADREHTTVLDEAGERVRLPFDIDTLAVTPELGPGDLLLARGDTFHRTQDSDTARVALSLRVTDPNLPIRLSDLARGSSKKLEMMAGNWAEFGPVFAFLDDQPDGTARWEDVRSACRETPALAGGGTSSRWVGRRRILREKMRRGLLIDSARRELSYRTARRRVRAGG